MQHPVFSIVCVETNFPGLNYRFMRYLTTLLLGMAVFTSSGQYKFTEASFNGGVTVGGWSPPIGGQSFAPGNFSIYIEPGSTILGAYLIAGRLGPALDYTVNFNGTDYIFGMANEVTGGFNTLYGSPSGVHVYDLTSVTNPSVLNYTINCPSSPSGGYFQDFEFVVFYENPSLPLINAAIFLNTFDLNVPSNTWNLNLGAPIDNSVDVMLSFFNSYQCFAGGDAENITVNGTLIGSTYNNDLNSSGCTGTLGNCYYQSATLTALGDDNANQAVQEYDALSNIKNLVGMGSTDITVLFTHGGGNFDNHQWSIVAAYGNSCDAPVAQFESNTPCLGDATQFTNNSSIDAVSWLWNFGDGNTSDAYEPQYTYATSGTFNVSLTAYGIDGCSHTATQQLTVLPIPNVQVASTFDCVAQEFNLQASGASTYSWTPGNEITSAITVDAVQGFTYTVEGTAAGCTGSATVTLNVPPPLSVNLSGTTATCGLNDAVITATVSGGTLPYTYTWTGVSASGAIAVNVGAGNYQLLIIDGDNCPVEASITIDQTPAPVVSINGPEAQCPGTEISLTATGADTYVWNTGSLNATLIASPLVSSTYTVTGTVGGCSHTVSWTQDVLPVPVIDLQPFITINLGESADVEASVTTGSGSEGVLSWYPPLFLDCVVCTEQTITPEFGLQYNVMALDPLTGCISFDSLMVYVTENFFVWVPNTITLNNDNVNEVFSAVGVKSGIMKIYNRWGELIFETDDPARGWNGDSGAGYYAPNEVYVWYLEYDTPLGRQKMRGHVTVLR